MMRQENRNHRIRERERFRRMERRRRRVRRIRRAIVCMFSLMMILILLGIITHMLKPFREMPNPDRIKHAVVAFEQENILEETDSESNMKYEIPWLDELKAMEEQDGRIRNVVEHAEEYPEKVLKMLAKNIETLDFVLDYFDKKDLPCSETIGESEINGEIPLLIQWDERWGYGSYGSSMVAVSGCGPTCIAMVASGLTGRTDITPYSVASYSEENGFLTPELDTSWDLMTYGCEEFDITGTMLGLDEAAMANTLNGGCPIICSMGPGDFTESGHFIVLTSYEDGAFHVNDPNSRIRSGQTWSYEMLKDQIVNMWYYTVTGDD